MSSLVPLAIFSVIPLVLYLKERHKLLITWILLNIFVDIFSVQTHFNFSALKIAGLILFPFALKNSFLFIKNTLTKLLLTQQVILIISFFAFSFFFPWENHTSFSYFEISTLRGFKQIGTNLSEFSLIIILGSMLKGEKDIKFTLKAFLFCGFFSLLGIFLEKLFFFDFFHFFTGGHELSISDRMRGFSFEPRAASQYMAYFILFILTYTGLSKKLMAFSLAIAFLGFFLANSMSGFLILGCGIMFLLLVSYILNHPRKGFLATIIGASVVLLLVFFQTPMSKDIKKYLSHRTYVFTEKDFIQRFEHADAAAVNFFYTHPEYLLTGIGAGQAALVTTPYQLEKSHPWFKEGFTYLPFMGIILDLANGGLVLIGVKLMIIFIGARSILGRNWKNDNLKKEIFIISILFTTLYFLQARYFHILGYAFMFTSALDLKRNKHE